MRSVSKIDRSLRFALAVFAASGLAACGQTGSLYLPEESTSVVIREAKTESAPQPPPVQPQR